jgi:hypothetical protein
MQRITPMLWFDNQAEEAANFYVSVFKNSKVKQITLRSIVLRLLGVRPFLPWGFLLTVYR